MPTCSPAFTGRPRSLRPGRAGEPRARRRARRPGREPDLTRPKLSSAALAHEILPLIGAELLVLGDVPAGFDTLGAHGRALAQELPAIVAFQVLLVCRLLAILSLVRGGEGVRRRGQGGQSDDEQERSHLRSSLRVSVTRLQVL